MVTPSPQDEPALEIRALGITKQFRGKGYASMILNDFIDSNVHLP
ncbi:GNAT family N-acetyltransferase (fragment) [Enterobacterales bacterium 8AC]